MASLIVFLVILLHTFLLVSQNFEIIRFHIFRKIITFILVIRLLNNFWFYLGEYQCTAFGCKWNDYVRHIDWGFYNDTEGNRTECKSRCSNDPNCGAYEWSFKYCSWWRHGVCQNISDATSNFFTCRKRGIVILVTKLPALNLGNKDCCYKIMFLTI